MSKKNKEEKIEEKNEEKVEEKVEKNVPQKAPSEDDKILIEKFVKDHDRTSGLHNSYAAGFKVWFKTKDEKNSFARKTMSEWKRLFEEFLSSPVK